MRSFELVYELKQQTPIIHFQYDQIGAALRATEVKPKLDRYIIERFGGIDKVRLEKSEWLIEGTNALKYRMVIKAPDEDAEKSRASDIAIKLHNDRSLSKEQKSKLRAELRNQINSMYFGNMVPDRDNGSHRWIDPKEYEALVDKTFKETVFYKNKPITLTIVCRNPELRKFIEDHINNFFITTNFGTRQNKGFGSFVIDDNSLTKNRIANALMDRYKAACCYYFAGGNDPMKRIQLIYGIMKSGVNFGGYRRSLLFLYMHDNKIGNEKAWLKNQGMAPTNVGRHAAKSNARRTSLSAHPHHYVRAFLGTGEKIEFLKDLNNPSDKAIIGISSATIERYKSPIFFKIIGEWVFYIADKSNPTVLQKLKNSVFEFESDFNSEKNTLTVPSSFDIEAFLEYCHRELNLDQDALNNEYRNSGYKALCEFSQMKNKEESDKDERFQINIISKGGLEHE